MCLSKVDLSNYNRVGLLLDRSNLLIRIYSCTQKLVIFAQNMQLYAKICRIRESPLALSWLMVDILLTSFLMLATLSRSWIFHCLFSIHSDQYFGPFCKHFFFLSEFLWLLQLALGVSLDCSYQIKCKKPRFTISKPFFNLSLRNFTMLCIQ